MALCGHIHGGRNWSIQQKPPTMAESLLHSYMMMLGIQPGQKGRFLLCFQQQKTLHPFLSDGIIPEPCWNEHPYYLSRLMTKPTKWHVRPLKTQISLGIHPVWSESSLCAQWVAKDPSFLHVDSEDWSDWADAQADLSLHWAHMPFCWFCHEAAHLFV